MKILPLFLLKSYMNLNICVDFEKECLILRAIHLSQNAVPTLYLPPPLDDSVMVDFPLHCEEKSDVLKVLQDITNSELMPRHNEISSNNPESSSFESFIPLSSSSKAPQELIFKKTTDPHYLPAPGTEVPVESINTNLNKLLEFSLRK